MKARISRYLIPALLAAAVPATVVFAQQAPQGPSPSRNRSASGPIDRACRPTPANGCRRAAWKAASPR